MSRWYKDAYGSDIMKYINEIESAFGLKNTKYSLYTDDGDLWGKLATEYDDHKKLLRQYNLYAGRLEEVKIIIYGDVKDERFCFEFSETNPGEPDNEIVLSVDDSHNVSEKLLTIGYREKCRRQFDGRGSMFDDRGTEYLDEDAPAHDRIQYESHYNFFEMTEKYKTEFPQYEYPYKLYNGHVINLLLHTAKVKYIGEDNWEFTNGKIYDAYFVEYCNGKRKNLHVKCDEDIEYFAKMGDFTIVEDKYNVLNNDEAIVECTQDYVGEFRRIDYEDTAKVRRGTITCGKKYRAIGRTRNGLLLVMDDLQECRFYPPECFKIISDETGILEKENEYMDYLWANIQSGLWYKE